MSSRKCSSCGSESTVAMSGDFPLYQVAKLAKVIDRSSGTREDLYDTLFTLYWCRSCGHIDLFVIPAQQPNADEVQSQTSGQ